MTCSASGFGAADDRNTRRELVFIFDGDGRLQRYLSHLTVFGRWLLWVRFVREASSFLEERQIALVECLARVRRFWVDETRL
jgi:hypothetical protein